MVAFKTFTKNNLSDAQLVVSGVFDSDTCNLASMVLRNPVLSEVNGVGSGEIAYIDGKPVGFCIAIPKWVAYKQDCFLGIAASTVGVLPEARGHKVSYSLVEKIVQPRFGSKIVFGNSGNANGSKLFRRIGANFESVQSCAEKRLAILHLVRFVKYLFYSKVLHRECKDCLALNKDTDSKCCIKYGSFEVKTLREVDVMLFDAFWEKYLSSNEGLVCVRRARDLIWMFGDKLKNGNALIAGCFEGSKLVGYVVFALNNSYTAWHVADMIALRNDLKILSIVLRGGLKILAKMKYASHCEISGFSDCVQSVIAPLFTIKRKLSNNQFVWCMHEDDTLNVDIKDVYSNKSWFFGPCDGDNWML